MTEDDGYDLLCPVCDSSDVHFESYSRTLFFWCMLLLRFPIPVLAKAERAKCRQCGHKWKPCKDQPLDNDAL